MKRLCLSFKMLLTISGIFVLIGFAVSTDLNSSLVVTLKRNEKVNLPSRIIETENGRKKRMGGVSETNVSYVTSFHDINNSKNDAAEDENSQKGKEVKKFVQMNSVRKEQNNTNSFDGMSVFRRRLTGHGRIIETTDYSDAAKAFYDDDGPPRTNQFLSGVESDGVNESPKIDSNPPQEVYSNTRSRFDTPISSVENIENGTERHEEVDANNVTSSILSRSEQNLVERITREVNIPVSSRGDTEVGEDEITNEGDELQDFAEHNKEVQEVVTLASRLTTTTTTEDNRIQDEEYEKVDMNLVREEMIFPVSLWKKWVILITKYRWTLVGLVLESFVIIVFFIPWIKKMRWKS